jgi:hypothetical protein
MLDCSGEIEMSEKHKLVPAEPTQEMLEAGVHTTYGETIYDTVKAIFGAMLAAAPAVQGEPVTWPLASKEESDKGWTIDYRFLEQVEKVASQRTDFTTSMEAVEQVLIAASELLCAPQPVEQQPSAHWSHDNPGLADQYRAEALAARRSLGFEQDADDVAPADISAAIESLQAECEKLRSLIHDIKEWDCDVDGGFLSIPLDLRRRIQKAIDAALAAYRKQRGEV